MEAKEIPAQSLEKGVSDLTETAFAPAGRDVKEGESAVVRLSKELFDPWQLFARVARGLRRASLRLLEREWILLI